MIPFQYPAQVSKEEEKEVFYLRYRVNHVFYTCDPGACKTCNTTVENEVKILTKCSYDKGIKSHIKHKITLFCCKLKENIKMFKRRIQK